VDHYANTALVMLLPAVEEGIFNDNWRIRQSSVLLMGKLLFKVNTPLCRKRMYFILSKNLTSV
jgi:hypothetical protein